jgi:hypothetical protein
MSYLIVGSEHDMEVQISYVTELAQNASKSSVDIAFPSMLFAELFMENLMINFKNEKVPTSCGLSININVPKEEGDIDDT